VTYADKTSGISFQYPRKYALETGTAANELVSSDPVPMDFVQPGGVALAAVALPESAYPNSDLASAFFGVSVNKESRRSSVENSLRPGLRNRPMLRLRVRSQLQPPPQPSKLRRRS